MSLPSILHGASPAEVQAEPFAHLVRSEAFPPAWHEELAGGFPPYERFLPRGVEPGNNQAIRIPASRVLEDPGFSGAWKEFFRYHTSQAFWEDLVRTFGPSLRARYPEIESRAGRPFETWRAKLRGTPGEAEVALDALFVINTPVSRESSVRPPHVDYEEKILAALYYLRLPEDDSTGGDLALYRFHPGRAAFGGHYARLKDLEERRVVPYRSNTFVAFVNSPDGLHGVTPRRPTPHLRRYVNFIAETPFPAFSLPKLDPLRRLIFRFSRRQKENGLTLRY